MKPHLVTLILSAAVGGSVAGALDLAYAFAVYGARGVPPLRILHSIASGVMGKAAHQGGLEVGVFGAAIHFTIATLMAAAFICLSLFEPRILKAPVVCGALYGAGLFALMNYVVVPMSAAYPGTRPVGWMLMGSLMAHMALVGVPIALITRWFFSCNESPGRTGWPGLC